MKTTTENKFKQTDLGTVPEDWEIKSLGEVLSLLKDGSHNPPKRVKEGTRFIAGASDMKYLSVDFSNCTYISQEDYKQIHKFYEIKANDVLLTIVGTVGNVAIVKHSDLPFSLQRSIAILRANERLNHRFLFYWLNTPKFKQMLHSTVNPTAQPGIYLGELSKLLMPFPGSREQGSIAGILSDFDSKIELNQQMNKTLEAIAQAIFKHWFIDFEFPNEEGKPYKSSGGEMVYNEEMRKEIPRGWAVRSIDEIAHFLNGLALQRFPPGNEGEYLPVIKIRELRQGVTESSDKASTRIPEEYIIEDGDVLFSWSGSLEVVIWTSGKGALNQHLFKVTSLKFPKWFYYHWILQHLQEYRHIAEGKATTMGHIQRRHLTGSLVLVPDEATLGRMDRIQGPVMEKLIQIGVESRNLARVRDLLLPKLMSGKIRVPVEVR